METPRGDVLRVLWGLGLLGVMGVWVQGVPAGTPNLLGSPLRVAQCRVKCVHTVSNSYINRSFVLLNVCDYIDFFRTIGIYILS